MIFVAILGTGGGFLIWELCIGVYETSTDVKTNLIWMCLRQLATVKQVWSYSDLLLDYLLIETGLHAFYYVPLFVQASGQTCC